MPINTLQLIKLLYIIVSDSTLYVHVICSHILAICQLIVQCTSPILYDYSDTACTFDNWDH